MSKRAPPRLFVETPLAAGAEVKLGGDQSHYLLNVLRLTQGDRVLLFNGEEGEWLAAVANVARKSCTLHVETCSRPQPPHPDLVLLFAPIKRQPIDLLAEKATELGVGRLIPVLTERTVVERVNRERLRAHMIEAAEQCGILSVPELEEPMALPRLLADWKKDRHILYCDEAGAAPPLLEVLTKAEPMNYAVLTGPEGGFTEAERALLRAHNEVIPVSLGPRIMRADTAAIAALAVVQAARGDWRRE